MSLQSTTITVPELYGVPIAPVLGSYGGGDSMMMARQILVQNRPADLIPEQLRQAFFFQNFVLFDWHVIYSIAEFRILFESANFPYDLKW
jgi:hypothetical protein